MGFRGMIATYIILFLNRFDCFVKFFDGMEGQFSYRVRWQILIVGRLAIMAYDSLSDIPDIVVHDNMGKRQ